MTTLPETGCGLCRPVLEGLAGETYEAWHRRKADGEGLLTYDEFCDLMDRADPGLANFLRQRPSADLLEIALSTTEVEP
jgi:hypothetical protein